jgi:hypothetical protein
VVRTVWLGVLCLFWSATAFTQSLTVPTVIFAGAAASDLATTYAGLSRDGAREYRELNPLLSITHSRPAPTVALGAATDAAGVWAWNRYVGRRHQKWAGAGLYAAAGFRLWCAGHNLRALRQESSKP